MYDLDCRACKVQNGFKWMEHIERMVTDLILGKWDCLHFD